MFELYSIDTFRKFFVKFLSHDALIEFFFFSTQVEIKISLLIRAFFDEFFQVKTKELYVIEIF